MSNTSRTLKLLRDQGWQCQVVEKYIKFGNMKFGRRIDVFRFGDVLACREPKYSPMGDHRAGEIALVQTCSSSGGDFAERRAKILALHEASIWARSGGIILLIGWARRGPRGKRKLWTPKIETL
jgi:hypothetical protein